MARIFISYKRKNKEQVFSIVQRIESQLSIKCWVDLDGIESSALFVPKICHAIDMADVVLFMHSSVHLNIDWDTDWTIKELNYAKEKGKKVVLIKLDSSHLDNYFLMEFGAKNNIDSRDETQFQKLIYDLKKWLALSVAPEKQSHTDKESKLFSPGPNDTSTIPYKNVQVESEHSIVTPEEMNLCATYIDRITHRRYIGISEIETQIESLAVNGITEAEFALGFGEYHPYSINIRVGGDSHYKAAEHWLEKAAKKGHLKAQATLAEMYYYGKEAYKAIPWAILASNNEDLKATLILAWCYKEISDEQHYVDTIKKAAELQKASKNTIIHNPALEYGNILLKSKNIDEAISWFDTAIDLAYDLNKKAESTLCKAQALYEQGQKLKALLCLEKAPDVSLYSDSISTLKNKISSELNPISRFFRM